MHAIFMPYIHFLNNYSKPKAEKEIKIVLSKVDQLHNGLGHAKANVQQCLAIHFVVSKVSKFCGQHNFLINKWKYRNQIRNLS